MTPPNIPTPRTDDAEIFDLTLETSVGYQQTRKMCRILERELILANQTIAELKKDYNELIIAVARKFPNETRHQTALRYINEAETSDSSPASAIDAAIAKQKKGE